MLFNKLRTYSLESEVNLSEIEQISEENVISAANTNTPLVYGLAAVVPATQTYALTVDQCCYMKIAIDEKKVARKEVNEKLNAKLEAYSFEHGVKMDKAQKLAARDAIELELMSKKEAKRTYIQVLIDNKHKVVHTDATSDKNEDPLFKVMHRVFASLPLSPYFKGSSLRVHAKIWLEELCVPAPFQGGDFIEFTDGLPKPAQIKFNNISIFEHRVVSNSSTMHVNKIELGYGDWFFKYDSKSESIVSIKNHNSKMLDERIENAGGSEAGSSIEDLLSTITIIREDFYLIVCQLKQLLLTDAKGEV